jgi:hypothetical protein
VRGGDALGTDSERGDRWRKEKLRRGVERDGRLSGETGERGGNSSVWLGGVIISWVLVVVRMNVISGVGGEVETCWECSLADFSVLNSSRLWRIFRKDGILPARLVINDLMRYDGVRCSEMRRRGDGVGSSGDRERLERSMDTIA